jgi:hypothetical protein
VPEHYQSNGIRFAREKFSTVLLKSLWKREIKNTDTPKNTELGAVCTKMEHFFTYARKTKVLKLIFG